MLGRMVGRHSRRRRRLGRVWCGLKRNKWMGRIGGFGAIGSRRRVVIVGDSIGPSWPVCVQIALGSRWLSSCGSKLCFEFVTVFR
jgi:hypothetical protein